MNKEEMIAKSFTEAVQKIRTSLINVMNMYDAQVQVVFQDLISNIAKIEKESKEPSAANDNQA